MPPSPNVLQIAGLETLEKLSKMVFQVNNHLGTFLFDLDKAVESLPAMAKRCLMVASLVLFPLLHSDEKSSVEDGPQSEIFMVILSMKMLMSQSVRNLLQIEKWVASIDLHIPIHRTYWKCLPFRWQGI